MLHRCCNPSPLPHAYSIKENNGLPFGQTTANIQKTASLVNHINNKAAYHGFLSNGSIVMVVEMRFKTAATNNEVFFLLDARYNITRLLLDYYWSIIILLLS